MDKESGPDIRSQRELLQTLNDGEVKEQRIALKRLAAVGDAEALDAVIIYLGGEIPVEVTRVGLETLRILANKFVPSNRYELVEALTPYLVGNDWGHRLIAVRLLSTHPNELATEPIRTLIEDAREKKSTEGRGKLSQIRLVAERTLVDSILALASCAGLSAIPDIYELLDEPELRPVATRALGVIGSETERDRLMEELIEDDDHHVRDAAQWSLGLMDDRQEMFMRPPDQQPQPPPDRLSTVYWNHRKLVASEDDDLIQFLVVRIAIEHLMLDSFISEGRVPEECQIILRRYEGSDPPDGKRNRAEIIGLWSYRWAGPTLKKQERLRRSLPRSTRATITISFPDDILENDAGLVSFDSRFGPFMGRGWVYRIAELDEGWTFSLVRRTWKS